MAIRPVDRIRADAILTRRGVVKTGTALALGVVGSDRLSSRSTLAVRQDEPKQGAPCA